MSFDDVARFRSNNFFLSILQKEELDGIFLIQKIINSEYFEILKQYLPISCSILFKLKNASMMDAAFGLLVLKEISTRRYADFVRDCFHLNEKLY